MFVNDLKMIIIFLTDSMISCTNIVNTHNPNPIFSSDATFLATNDNYHTEYTSNWKSD